MKVLVAVLCLAAYASATKYTHCNHEDGTAKIISVDVDGKEDCEWKRNTPSTITIKFESTTESETAVAVATAYTFGASNIDIGDKNACNSGVNCPIKKGSTHEFKKTVDVGDYKDHTKVNIMWDIDGDDHDHDIVCIWVQCKYS